jgi:histidyl-tRNA synthetase
MMDLRKEGFLIELSYSGNVGKQLKHANKINACIAILLGSDEIATACATVRNLDTGDQNSVAFSGLKDYLNHFMYPNVR